MVCAVLGGWSFVLLFVLCDQPLIEAQLLPIHWSEFVHWAAWEVKVEMNGATVEAEGSCLLLQEKWEVQLQGPRKSGNHVIAHWSTEMNRSQCSRLRQFQGKTATSPKGRPGTVVLTPGGEWAPIKSVGCPRQNNLGKKMLKQKSCDTERLHALPSNVPWVNTEFENSPSRLSWLW